MDSITRFYANNTDKNPGKTARLGFPGRNRAVVLALILAACSQGQSDFGFQIDQVDSRSTPGGLDVLVHQEIVFSREAREALDHGVPLAIETELAWLTAASSQELARESKSFEIRYLPLSNRYQLTSNPPLVVKSFPRLRHLLAEVSEVKFSLTSDNPPAGPTQLKVRSYIEKQNMPPPMRLPAWFSSQWHHDSGWQIWPASRRAST